MKKLEDILNEMTPPIAKSGDWDTNFDEESYSKTIINLKWKLLHNNFYHMNYTLEFRQLTNNLNFILGYWNNEGRFSLVSKIDFTRMKSIERHFNLKRLIKVNGVYVNKDFQGLGIAQEIYTTLVNDLEYTILSDGVQYFGARKLRVVLSKQIDVIVDIIDLSNNVIIKKNVELIHGENDEQFDPNYWSTNEDKESIRFIIKKYIN